jgi:hypothetical protein
MYIYLQPLGKRESGLAMHPSIAGGRPEYVQ